MSTMSSPAVMTEEQKNDDENSDCTVHSVLMKNYATHVEQHLLKDGHAHKPDYPERTDYRQAQNNWEYTHLSGLL